MSTVVKIETLKESESDDANAEIGMGWMPDNTVPGSQKLQFWIDSHLESVTIEITPKVARDLVNILKLLCDCEVGDAK